MAEGEAQRTATSTGYAESVLLCGDADSVVAVADELQGMHDVNSHVLVRTQYAKAKILEQREDAAGALAIYTALSADVSTVEGAESAYKVIFSLYEAKRLDECEEAIYAFADKKTPHNYWLGKSFILLGDIYVDRSDAFQAKATYRSVVDGYTPTDDGIVAEATAKLEKLN